MSSSVGTTESGISYWNATGDLLAMTSDSQRRWNGSARGNDSTDLYAPCQLKMTTMNIILTVCFTTIFTLSVVGNCLVIVTIAQNRWMRTVTNIFLQSLAISDLLLSVICMPPTLTAMLFHCFLWGKAMCKLLTYLQPVSVAASAYTLVAIALERYNAICRPLHSRHWKTKSHAVKVIVAVWVISLVGSSPSLFVYDLAEIRPGQWNCRDDWGAMEDLSGYYYLFMVVVLFIGPLVLMVVLYSAVTYTLWMGIKLDSTPSNGEMSSPSEEHSSIRFSTTSMRHRLRESKPVIMLRRFGQSIRHRASSGIILINRSSARSAISTDGIPKSATADYLTVSSRGAKSSNASLAPTGHPLRSTHMAKSLETKKRVIIMLFAIVAEFLMCWSPLYVYNALYYLGYVVSMDPYLATFLVVSAYVSSCTNPITYCFLNLKFRQAFLLAFGCRFMVKNASLMHQNTLHRYNPNFQNLTLRKHQPASSKQRGSKKYNQEEDSQSQRVIDNVLVQCHEPASTSMPLVQLRKPSVRLASAEETSGNCDDQVYDSDDDEMVSHDDGSNVAAPIGNGTTNYGNEANGTTRTSLLAVQQKLEKLSSL